MDEQSETLPLREPEDRIGNEEERYTCPRCRSTRTVKCDEPPLAGYQKCIICGNCWNAKGSRDNRAPKVAPETSNDTA